MQTAVIVLGLMLTASTVAVNGANVVRILRGGAVVMTSTAKAVTHPVRHPKKDAKAVGHWLKGDR